ncbi:hypothetical protein BH09VER1_BH09VER1_45790 [soil metagenome]
MALPACESLPMRPAPATSLDRARVAWQELQTLSPGTPAAARVLRVYDESVREVVASLRSREGTTEWAQPMTVGGSHPWRITFDPPEKTRPERTYALAQFSRCGLASGVRVHHFAREIAHRGLGVPVVLAQDDSQRVAQPFHPPRGEFLPATAVLEFPASAAGQPVEARLHFYNPLAVSQIPVGKNSQPLAENLTAALESAFIESSVRAGKNPHGPAPSASGEQVSQLYYLNRYDPHKIPVVFVHGLRCGPGVWKNSVNALLDDPELRRRYQPVCFIYPTKLPVPIAAARLRELLIRSRDELDPAHRDAGYAHIVLVGHSMGGLLVRLQVTDSGSDFWYAYFNAPPAEIYGKLDAKTHQMIKKALFFHRQTNIGRIIFIAVPHRGSVAADGSVLRALARALLYLPRTSQQHLKKLTSLPEADINPVLRDFYSVGEDGAESLSTKHPMFRVLEQRPVPVPFNSIIATRGEKDLRTSSDGLVPYWSSHLDGAETEAIVSFPHGCLEQADTVNEINRVLKQAP